jgi:DNA polymerase III epsilon subunit-like protein
MSNRGFSTSIPTVAPNGFVVIDTETTGSTADARVIELGMVFLSSRGTQQKTFSTLLFGDGTNGEWYVRRVHRISQKELVGAPHFKDIASSFLKSLEGRTVFAHNSNYDLKRLNHELVLARRRQIEAMACTIELGKHLGFGRLSLEKAIETFDLTRPISHHALYDAVATGQLLRHYLGADPDGVREYLTNKGLGA